MLGMKAIRKIRCDTCHRCVDAQSFLARQPHVATLLKGTDNFEGRTDGDCSFMDFSPRKIRGVPGISTLEGSCTLSPLRVGHSHPTPFTTRKPHRLAEL